MSIWLDPGDSVLVLCAHPDDEIGAGGLIRRLTLSGIATHCYYFSKCTISTQSLGFPPAMLLDEFAASCATLGIKSEHFGGFDFPVRQFPAHRQEILDTLLGLRKQLNPKLIITASTHDIHQDHSTLTEEAIRAFKHQSILGFEFPWNNFNFENDLFVALSPEIMNVKAAAWSQYKTQRSRDYADDSLMKSMAQVRGAQCGALYAECYEVIRIVI